MLRALVLTSHALQLDLHLFHAVLELGHLMFELIFVTVEVIVVAALAYQVLDFIYDSALLILNLTPEVFETDSGFNVCRHFSHGALYVVDVGFLAHLDLKFLSAALAFAIHHPLGEFEFFNLLVLGFEDVADAFKSQFNDVSLVLPLCVCLQEFFNNSRSTGISLRVRGLSLRSKSAHFSGGVLRRAAVLAAVVGLMLDRIGFAAILVVELLHGLVAQRMAGALLFVIV